MPGYLRSPRPSCSIPLLPCHYVPVLTQLVGRDIQKVEFGWPLGMPYCRSLGDGLWEVRSDLTDGRIGRVIFCVARERMVLLHSLVKKT